MGLYLSRETFRSLWGVLTLLPAPAGVYPGMTAKDNPNWTPPKGGSSSYAHPCANFDMYNAAAWGLDLDLSQTANLQTVLTSVAAFHKDLHTWHTDPAELLQECCDRMLMVAGVGYKSLFRLEYRDKLGGLWTSMEKTTDRIPGDPNRDSDGRVPLASAKLKRVTTRYVKGVHGGLTNIPAVYNDVFRWLKKEPLTSLAASPEDALGGHLSAGAVASEAPHLDGSAKAHDDDPGYWDLSDAPSIDRVEVDRRLDTGGMPDFNLLKIL